jgi:hypothetical protein
MEKMMQKDLEEDFLFQEEKKEEEEAKYCTTIKSSR